MISSLSKPEDIIKTGTVYIDARMENLSSFTGLSKVAMSGTLSVASGTNLVTSSNASLFPFSTKTTNRKSEFTCDVFEGCYIDITGIGNCFITEIIANNQFKIDVNAASTITGANGFFNRYSTIIPERGIASFGFSSNMYVRKNLNGAGSNSFKGYEMFLDTTVNSVGITRINLGTPLTSVFSLSTVRSEETTATATANQSFNFARVVVDNVSSAFTDIHNVNFIGNAAFSAQNGIRENVAWGLTLDIPYNSKNRAIINYIGGGKEYICVNNRFTSRNRTLTSTHTFFLASPVANGNGGSIFAFSKILIIANVGTVTEEQLMRITSFYNNKT